MKVYNYSRFTQEFISEEDAFKDPVASERTGKDVFMLPAYSTFEAPPKTGEQEVAVYNLAKNEWEVKADFRGSYMYDGGEEPEKITKIGDLPKGFIIVTKEQADMILEEPLYYIIKNKKLVKNPKFKAVKLQEAKDVKLQEALDEALNYIESRACYRVDENNSIEATDGNIGKLTAHALGILAGVNTEVSWTSKEDNVITLNKEALITVLQGLGAVQANVWNVKYVNFVQEINSAETVEAVNGIVIDYSEE